MQDCGAGFQGGHDALAFRVDHLHLVVVRVGKVHPYLPAIRPGHDEHGLSGDLDGAGLLPVAGIHHEHLMPAYGGHECLIASHRPAFQVRHLVYRQLLFAAPIMLQNASYAALRVPEIKLRHAVLAEQARHVVAAIRRQERVIGLVADAGIAGDCGRMRLAEVGYPDLAGVEQAVQKSLTRSVGHPHYARATVGTRHDRSRNIGDRSQRTRIGYLDSTRLVAAYRNQGTVLADGAADAVAALHDTAVDASAQQVDFCESAVSAENIGVALVARENDRRMRQIAQAVDPAQAVAASALDDLQAARGALDDDTEIACAAQRRLRAPRKYQEAYQQGAHHGSGCPCSSRSASHAISCAESTASQLGMGVPGRPWVIVATSSSRGLPARACGVRGGPKPPVKRRPWHEPQSWRNRCSSCCGRSTSRPVWALHDRAAPARTP